MSDVGKRKLYILIIYDITDNKRRNKLAKFLNAYGYRVQRSAFEAVLTMKQYLKLKKGLPKYVTTEDSIRVYKLDSFKEVEIMGKKEQCVYEDIIIF